MKSIESALWQSVRGRVVSGHGIASGQGRVTPYPAGSIKMQIPFFRQHGVDLRSFYKGTINVDVAPARFVITDHATTLRAIEWTALHPPEDFSFSPCRLVVGRTKVEGLIYFPHPETKERHFQSDTTIEVLAPFIEGLGPGTPVTLEIDAREVEII